MSCCCVDSSTQAHTHHQLNQKYSCILFFIHSLDLSNQLIEKIEQSLFIRWFSFDSCAMAKVPKRDIGFFLHMVRNGLLGVSIDETIWIVFALAIYCFELHNLSWWM